MHPAVLAAFAAGVVGWSDAITVEPSRGERPNTPWQISLAGLDRPSERTLETLRRYDDLDVKFRRDPDSALELLEREARRDPNPELVFALAELSWIEGKRHDRRRRPAALDRFVDAVAYAYDFLFDPELASGRQPADPRFRLAMDLYNGGLDHIIRAAQAKGRIEPGGMITLRVPGRELHLRVGLEKSPWSADDIDELRVASDFIVSGLPTKSYQYGLGVPLIGIRKSDRAGTGEERFFPPEMAFPLTAFLRPNSRLRDANADVDAPRDCTLDLLDPVQIRSVVVQQPNDPSRAMTGSFALAIEADLTTPLAYMWSRTDLSRYRWTGLLRPGAATERAGLMLLRPYEPNKIPVVMVHGLASSPLAWIPMLNELLRDPQIQQHYQFLLFVYPTGVAVPIAASFLRDALVLSSRQFETPEARPSFERMVLLGHSMGGLLSHAMVVDSDNRFWELNSDRSFGEMIGDREVLEEIAHYTFFKPLPFVERVVFLATPHRGSEYSRRPIGRIGSSLISEPDHYIDLLSALVKKNPEAFDRRQFRRLPTSIDTLEPDSPVLLALLAMKPRPEVKLHSIIGNYRGGPISAWTDGIVSYRSAHIEGVPEKVVRSDHGVQKDADAIREVRKILLQHLGEQQIARAPVLPR
jgi:pimeloyl-ACP methyl ester carboxylesterase